MPHHSIHAADLVARVKALGEVVSCFSMLSRLIIQLHNHIMDVLCISCGHFHVQTFLLSPPCLDDLLPSGLQVVPMEVLREVRGGACV